MGNLRRPAAGSIVIVDWRADALQGEPTKIRPAVVIEEHTGFPEAHPLVIVVPLTRDEKLVIGAFCERIDPTPENGGKATSWALAHHVSAMSRRRMKTTPARVTDEQLAMIRRRVALALGFE